MVAKEDRNSKAEHVFVHVDPALPSRYQSDGYAKIWHTCMCSRIVRLDKRYIVQFTATLELNGLLACIGTTKAKIWAPVARNRRALPGAVDACRSC